MTLSEKTNTSNIMVLLKFIKFAHKNLPYSNNEAKWIANTTFCKSEIICSGLLVYKISYEDKKDLSQEKNKIKVSDLG